MYVVNDSPIKPPLDEDLLMHYGIKGMKWGVRRGSSKTGVSRARGAQIDRNARHIKRTEDVLKGKGLRRDKIAYKFDSLFLGKDTTKALYKVSIRDMQQQNSRLKSGKATVRDKLTVLMSTTPMDLVVSNRPK